MKKLLFFLLPPLLATILFAGLILFVKTSQAKGALQVTSSPKDATVYLDGKLLGKTPLCKCEGQDMLQTGDYTIRIVPQDASASAFEQKITISQGILTAVDRTFGTDAVAEGSIISLSPLSNTHDAEVFVSSFPSGATIAVDSDNQGTTPTLVKNLTPSDHDISLTKEGYTAKTVRIHTVAGYKVTVIAYLGVDTTAIAKQASASATTVAQTQVVILQTPTGFLRVRKEPSLSGEEVAQVHPGESYPWVAEQDGWYQIKLSDGNLGWVSNSYAKKQ